MKPIYGSNIRLSYYIKDLMDIEINKPKLHLPHYIFITFLTIPHKFFMANVFMTPNTSVAVPTEHIQSHVEHTKTTKEQTTIKTLLKLISRLPCHCAFL